MKIKQAVVFIEDRKPWIGSVSLAEGFGVSHRDITNKLKKYEAEFLELSEGIDAFKMRQFQTGKAGKPFDEYVLNEEQAIYATTLLQNNAKVRKFKMYLSKEFVRQRRAISDLVGAIRNNRQNAEWLEARSSGKPVRRKETDVLQKLEEYQKMNGSQNSDKVYVSYSKMVNEQVFGDEVKKLKGRNIRDSVDSVSLGYLKVSDDLVGKVVLEEMEKKTEYHQIFQICREKMSKFIAFMGKRKIEDGDGTCTSLAT